MSSFTPAIDSDADDAPLSGDKNGTVIRFKGRSLLLKLAGVLIFLGAWYLGGQWVAKNTDTLNFAAFGPEPAITAISDLETTGTLIHTSLPCLK